MSKLVPLLFAGAGTATVSVGGFYLVKNSGSTDAESKGLPEIGQNSAQTGKSQESNGTPIALTFTNLQEFKKAKGGECAKKLFGSDGVDFGSLGSTINNEHKLTSTEFNSSGVAPNSTQSCLIIDWEKANYSVDSNTKWKGHFRWSWSFVSGNKGFIIFVTTKPSSLTLEGGFYLLENNSGWKVTKHKELDAALAITKDDLDKRMPKPGNILALTDESGSGNDYWGFVSGPEDIGKFCTQSEDCASASTNSPPLKKSWMWKLDSTSTENKLIDWTGNFASWLEGLFVKDQLQLETSLSNFSGTWKPSSSAATA